MAGPDPVILRERLEQAIGARDLAPERTGELHLAIACALGDPAALDAFDQLLREEVARVVRPLDPGSVDELTQVVRERLLVADASGRCRLEGFRAEAPLRAWVRAIALRAALNERRGREVEVPASQPPEAETAAADPELALLRARHRESFREAFTAALAALSPRERNVLRLHTLDGVTLVRIGALYQKDTSTISRWLEQVRRALLTNTRNHLATRLQLTSSELESVMRAADSEMSVSLQRLLADA
jgi:RNA polymerase sigma-70 factor (ECF subfamily)